jgi:glutathione peroxidase
VKWNFEKFLVSADRTKLARFRPQVEPDDAKLAATLESMLP